MDVSDRPEAEFLPPAGAGDSGAVSTGTGAGAGVSGIICTGAGGYYTV